MLSRHLVRAAMLAACLGLSGGASAQPGKAAEPAPEKAPKPPARKAPPRKAEKKKASSLDLAALQKDLESGDEARTLAALGRIGQSGEVEAAPLVDALLGRGASVKVLLEAIDVAATLGAPASASALVPYVAHRNPEVRLAAAQALSHTKAPEAAEALRRALRSSDPKVRSAAARGLGTLGAKEAVPELFAVLPKEVPEAAGSLGLLCSEDDCRKFIDLLGKLPFDVIESGLGPLFLRASGEVSDDLKIVLVERLRRLATRAATELLERTRTIWPEDASPKVKQAIEQALKGRPVGAGSG